GFDWINNETDLHHVHMSYGGVGTFHATITPDTMIQALSWARNNAIPQLITSAKDYQDLLSSIQKVKAIWDSGPLDDQKKKDARNLIRDFIKKVNDVGDQASSTVIKVFFNQGSHKNTDGLLLYNAEKLLKLFE